MFVLIPLVAPVGPWVDWRVTCVLFVLPVALWS